MPPKSREQADEAGPFNTAKFYRYSDLEDAGFVECWNNLVSWQQKFNFPTGKLVGHTRVWTGDELNRWFATRPTERLLKNRTRAA